MLPHEHDSVMQSTTVRRYILSYRSRETDLATAVTPRVWITGLSAVVILLSLAATLTGILTGFGQRHHTFVYSAGLFAFILSVLAIDPTRLRARFSGRFRRGPVGWTLIGFAALLALMWLGRIVPALASGTPPLGLESYSTLFVQAGDLGILVPLTTLSGVLLLMRKPAGFLLAGVMAVKGATFGLALVGMIVAMAALGAGFVVFEAVFFATLAIALTACAVHYIACLPPVPGRMGSEELSS